MEFSIRTLNMHMCVLYSTYDYESVNKYISKIRIRSGENAKLMNLLIYQPCDKRYSWNFNTAVEQRTEIFNELTSIYFHNLWQSFGGEIHYLLKIDTIPFCFREERLANSQIQVIS